jgi:hypothetical protein
VPRIRALGKAALLGPDINLTHGNRLADDEMAMAVDTGEYCRLWRCRKPRHFDLGPGSCRAITPRDGRALHARRRGRRGRLADHQFGP